MKKEGEMKTVTLNKKEKDEKRERHSFYTRKKVK
jgi:hypothetical protein